MTKKTDPETVLQNLKKMIEEAEETLSKATKRGGTDYDDSFPLKERLQSSLDRLRDYSNEVGDQVKDYYNEAEDRLRDYYDEAEERLRNGVETTNQTLSNHPYTLATVTFGLGVAAGALTRMIGRSR